ncbi:tRNA (N(6)-L-threonylcarbamoyladenosine(37)-C(2))-methylthiotransferase MtaB [Hyphococcus flavus]|uniref:tRNA (N(6)-L-threonylcarbamoyladenosine(37)-C(2))-methylthiotransferase n=1 Tax=Hyphococcus flavus TaxID=1866326 RepID=A0AAE9ZFI5_9PROT|nr:tRNA (N(6)-L-threonylcarbamoyladenosine(37)-C(2))-methylthiotransferase MtaB [Hyphococcus flavus]WDI32885.1 tRNA (N(6)-L-threonylcarbamoyladenosine(37)-C(2))-methylthiotransferase MtaB [Hyphococcus flavus]
MSDPDEIITLGCRLNLAESEMMRRLSRENGCCDSIIINTCAVTNEAVRTARQRIRRTKRDHPNSRIIVTGCAAQTEPDTFASMTEVSAVLGNHEKLNPDHWRKLAATEDQVIQVNDILSVRETAGHLLDGYGDRARAFVQIQNGCDHRCTFCIIPYGRGNSRSVPIDTIIEQTHRMVDAGHREVVLTGVDITSYGDGLEGAPTLGTLVGSLLDAVPELYRLRLSSIDGAEIDEALLERIIGDERVAPHLHLSLQAGDNLILKRMKRRHTREQAIELCRTVRERRPEVAFGADIIAGFPTETDDMFERSLGIIYEAGLQFLHVFPFSPRMGTPAARMPQVPGKIAKERARRLREAGSKNLKKFLDQQVGKTFEAIQESGGTARLGNYAQVGLNDSQVNPGEVVKVKVSARDGERLVGALV